MERPQISRRKDEHLQICAEQPVEYQRVSTWFEHVHLVPQALPDLALEDIDAGAQLCGRQLNAPLIIGAMTGGSETGGSFNVELAAAAQEYGVGLGLGSMRAGLRHPESLPSFQLRHVAPEALLIGNLGLQQLREYSGVQIRELMDQTGVDALAVHLNPGMEVFQAEGDRDFRGGREALARLADLLGDRLIVKETGCGIARETAKALMSAGVRLIDVAGAGGTSWIRVEALRAPHPVLAPEPGERSPFEEWGIPTAAAVAELAPLGVDIIASGGIRNGLDAAKALVLGAKAASAALPFLLAYRRGGADGLRRYLRKLIEEVKVTMLLTGCRDLAALRRCPRALTGPLAEWLQSRDVS